MRIILIISAILLLGCDTPAYADNHLSETRYCGEPRRDGKGDIVRNRAVIKEFEKLYPLPQGYDRSQWQVDHVIPLSVGGCDVLRNLQWLPKTIKTCKEDNCKDRWERSGIYPYKRNIK